MEYFDFDNASVYIQNAGKPYQKDHEAVKWWTDARSKLIYLIGLLAEKEDTSLTYNYKHKAMGQAGRAKFRLIDYVIVGFIPTKIMRKLERAVF